MKKLLTFLTMFTLFFGVGWAATMTYTPTNNTGAGTVTGGPSDLTLTNIHSGGNQMTSGQGLHLTTAYSPFTATISGLTSSYKVTRIVVTYCTNSKTGKGSISAKIGDTQVGSTFNVSAPSGGGGNTLKTTTLYNNSEGTPFVDNEDFIININVTTNAIYLNKVEIDYEEYSGPAAVATPTITLNPAAGPYYVGDEVTATITAVDGATISYNFDNGDEWTPYTAPVAIPNTTVGDVTIYAKATLDGVESSVATKTVTFGLAVANIAAFKELSNNDQFKFTGELTVTYYSNTYNQYLWVKDETGSALLYNTGNDPEQGKKIVGGWTGKKSIYHGLEEITAVSELTIVDGTDAVVPAELQISDITTDNQSTYGWLRGVQLINKDGQNFTLSDGSTSVAGRNSYGINLPNINNGITYDILGVIGVYDDAQFIPVAEFVEHQEAPNPDGYYIVGSFTNNWTRMDEWKLQQQSDGSYTLNNVEIPQYAQFKIVKVDGATVRWCGGAGGYTLDGQTVTAIDGASHANLPVWIDPDEDKGSNYYMLVGGMSNVKLAPGNLLTVNPVTVYYKKIDPANGNVLETVEMTPTATGWTINRTGMQDGDQFGFSDNWGVWHGGKQQDNNWAQIWEAQLGQPIYMSNDGNFIIKIAGDFNLSVNSDLNQMTADLIPQNYNLTCTAVSDVEGKTGGSIVVKVDGNTVQATEGVYSILSGKEVTLEITPNGGYNFNNVTLDGAALTATLNNEGKYIATFTMPRADAAVQANFTGIPYTITVTNDPEEGGTVTGLPAQAYAGQEGISFTVTPNEGYSVNSVVASFEGNQDVTLTPDAEGAYSFNMRPYNLEIKVTYKEVTGGGEYVKVTSSTDLTDGEYLIVYEGGTTVGPRAFNGALDADHINAANNCVEVEIYDDNTIPSTDAVDAATFTIDVTAGTIKSASGLYIGQTSNNNGMAPDAVTAHENSISIDGSKNAVISCSSGPSLRFNPSWPGFRYYKNAGQQPIALYKKVEQPEEVTLAELVADGEVNEYYTVTDLRCVDVLDDKGDVNNLFLLCKDVDGYANSDDFNNLNVVAPQVDHTFPPTDVMTGIVNPYNNNNYCAAWTAYDQSNWILLKVNAPTVQEATTVRDLKNKILKNVTGKFTDNVNPEMVVSGIPESNGTYEYTPNNYVVSSFYGTRVLTWNNHYNDVDHTENQIAFFVQPKPNELVRVIWAYWDGSKFVNSTEGVASLTGLGLMNDNITVNTTYYDAPASNGTFKIDGVVKVNTSNKAGETYSIMPTSPIEGQSVLTGVEDLNESVNGVVESVTYFNVSGMKSSKPFDGINIVVTRYTDGHTSTKKIVK